jgi:hypothetical protein
MLENEVINFMLKILAGKLSSQQLKRNNTMAIF